MKYWKIQFNDNREGFGYLEFDENMVATNIYDEEGSIITEAVGYFPIEFDNVIPPFIV
jgi:hypothetical protein